jgi:small conductance mechanosensitive channel
MKEAYDKLITKLWSWVDGFILMIPNLVVAIIVMVATVYISKGLRKIFSKVIDRFSTNTAVNKLFSSVLTVVTFIIGFFIALSILELDKAVTSLLAGAGVVGLAIGLAFQEPILNIFSGIVMSVREPFKIGDIVKTNDYFGTIDKITLRSTSLKKFSGEDVIIPNKMVIQNPIENYTKTKVRRVAIKCGVRYSDDLEKVEKIAIQAIEKEIPYDKSNPLELYFEEFGSSSINFELRFWLDKAEQKNYLKYKSEAIKSLKKHFDENDISIPFPIRTLDIDKGTIDAITKK